MSDDFWETSMSLEERPLVDAVKVVLRAEREHGAASAEVGRATRAAADAYDAFQAADGTP